MVQNHDVVLINGAMYSEIAAPLTASELYRAPHLVRSSIHLSPKVVFRPGKEALTRDADLEDKTSGRNNVIDSSKFWI